MDVPDLLTEFVNIANVAVVTPASLPEPISTMTDAKPVEHRRVKLTPPADRPLSDPLLKRSQYRRHTNPVWHDNQMDMLRHHHPRQQAKPKPITRCRERLNKDIPPLRTTE